MGEIEEKSVVQTLMYTGFPFFVETFLVPEVISIIISIEYECMSKEGFLLSWLSEPFGEKEYPYDPDCPILLKVQRARSVADLKKQYSKGEVAFSRPIQKGTDGAV